jgi:hypothetical protein
LRWSYLVAEALGCNDGNLIANSLVGLEVEGQLGVVSLNDDLGGLLNGLGTNATHDCGFRGLSSGEVEVVVVVILENTSKYSGGLGSLAVLDKV